MKPAIPILIIAFMSIYGCSADDSLQGAYERQIKENGMDGFNIIHLEERASVGLVLNTSWTNDYPENQFRPGIHVFEKTEGGWQAVSGTACDANTVARLSLFGNGQLYCASLDPESEVQEVRVGQSAAQIFDSANGSRVWFAITEERDAKAIGTTPDGREIKLN